MVHLLQTSKKFKINDVEWTLYCKKGVSNKSDTPYLKVVFGCETTKYVYSVNSKRYNQLYFNNSVYATITRCENIREAKSLVLQRLLS